MIIADFLLNWISVDCSHSAGCCAHGMRRESKQAPKFQFCITDASVIVEAGFVSSPSDAAFLCYMHKEITEAIASGIYDYMVDKEYAIRTRA